MIAACVLWCSCLGVDVTSSADGALRIEGALVTVIEEAEIPAREAGVLTVVEVREGMAVEVGGLLAGVDDVDKRLELDRALAEAQIAKSQAENDVNLRYARKTAEVADSELRRARESVARFERSISQTELDKLVLESDRCNLAVEEATHELAVAKQTWLLKQAEVAVARQAVERCRITSPLTGVVVQVRRRRGEWVKPGDMVLRVMRTDHLRVEALVPADRIPPNSVGAAVRFYAAPDAAGPKSYAGKLAFISPEVDPVNGQVRIWAEVENAEQSLRPGIRGTLELHVP